MLYLDCNHIYTSDFSTPDGSKGSFYQGAYPDNGDWVASNGYDVLVLCAVENQEADEYTGLEVIRAPGEDDQNSPNGWPIPEASIEGWTSAAKQVAQHVRAGKKVLITCLAGLNRSGIVSALALHELTGWDPEKIIWWIQKRRSGALFNRHFQRYLLENLKEVP